MNRPYGSLCVTELTKYCNDEELMQLFHAFGPVIQAKIIHRYEYSSTGLVTLSSFEAAEAARVSLDGCVYLGKKIRITWATSATLQASLTSNPVINSIYIRYSARKWNHMIRVEDLQQIFSSFGNLTEICIKDSHMDHRTGRQSGLAFVHFVSTTEGMHSAFRAVSGTDGNIIEGITFRSELSRNLLRQFGQNNKTKTLSPPSLEEPPMKQHALPVQQHAIPSSREIIYPPHLYIPQQQQQHPLNAVKSIHPSYAEPPLYYNNPFGNNDVLPSPTYSLSSLETTSNFASSPTESSGSGSSLESYILRNLHFPIDHPYKVMQDERVSLFI